MRPIYYKTETLNISKQGKSLYVKCVNESYVRFLLHSSDKVFFSWHNWLEIVPFLLLTFSAWGSHLLILADVLTLRLMHASLID